jgi:hypothetical protein
MGWGRTAPSGARHTEEASCNRRQQEYDMARSVIDARPRWRPTGHSLFLAAAKVEGAWWVMRLNDFPDHPKWTLFIDGNTERFDVEELPEHWEDPFRATGEPLDRGTVREVLASVEQFEVYGSEVGRPCDSGFCCVSRKPAPDPQW